MLLCLVWSVEMNSKINVLIIEINPERSGALSANLTQVHTTRPKRKGNHKSDYFPISLRAINKSKFMIWRSKKSRNLISIRQRRRSCAFWAGAYVIIDMFRSLNGRHFHIKINTQQVSFVAYTRRLKFSHRAPESLPRISFLPSNNIPTENHDKREELELA